MSTTSTNPTPTVQQVSDQADTTARAKPIAEERSEPVVDAPSPDPAPSTRRSSMLTAVIGIAIGLGIAGLAIWLTGRDNEDTFPPPTVAIGDATAEDDNAAGDTTAEATAFDPVDLVVAYGRSRTEDHALDGELRRGTETPLLVRRALLGDRAIEEVGATAAVTEAGETQQCELIEDQWLCAPPLPAIGSELDVQSFATLLLTEAPPYRIFDVSSQPPASLSSITTLGPTTCWAMISDERRDRARFGAESTLCFHNELGTLVGRSTETAAGTDVFFATELRSEVTVADVEPSR